MRKKREEAKANQSQAVLLGGGEWGVTPPCKVPTRGGSVLWPPPDLGLCLFTYIYISFIFMCLCLPFISS